MQCHPVLQYQRAGVPLRSAATCQDHALAAHSVQCNLHSPGGALARGRFSAPVAHCINRTVDGAASTATIENRAHRLGQAGGLGSESLAGQWPESPVEREASVTRANRARTTSAALGTWLHHAAQARL